MTSAFGIDHGEISKASLPRSRTAVKMGQFVRVTGTKAKKAGAKAVNAPISVKGIGASTGRGVGAAGRGVSRAGAALENHPGLTGSAVVAGATGAGAYGYKRAKNQVPRGM